MKKVFIILLLLCSGCAYIQGLKDQNATSTNAKQVKSANSSLMGAGGAASKADNTAAKMLSPITH